MIGDDIVSDVGGAQACGIRGVQVRTGKFRYHYAEKAFDAFSFYVAAGVHTSWPVLRDIHNIIATVTEVDITVFGCSC